MNASVATTRSWTTGSATATASYDVVGNSTGSRDGSLSDFFPDLGLYSDRGTLTGVNGARLEMLSEAAGMDVFNASLPEGSDGTNLDMRVFLGSANMPVAAASYLEDRTVRPGRDRFCLRGDLTQELPKGMELTLSLAHSSNEAATTRRHGNLRLEVAAGNMHNPFMQDVEVLRSSAGLPLMRTIGENNRWTFSADLDGSFGEWEWNVNVLTTREDAESFTRNELAVGILDMAVDDGSINPFAADLTGAGADQSLFLPDQFFDTVNEDATFEMFAKRSFDFLPAGRASVLLGASVREGELSFSHHRDNASRYSPVTAGAGFGLFARDTSTLENSELDLSNIEGAVTVDAGQPSLTSNAVGKSGFLEINMPLLKRFSVNVSARHEDTDLWRSTAGQGVQGHVVLGPDAQTIHDSYDG